MLAHALIAAASCCAFSRSPSTSLLPRPAFMAVSARRAAAPRRRALQIMGWWAHARGTVGEGELIRSLVMLLTARLPSSPRPPSIPPSAWHPVVFLPAQCTVRVNRDHKDNPEAQCTAYYLDFFKCADACQAKALFAQLK
eukprot:COSAG05_NODE_1151_length_5713_cov_19.933915_4_plen_140_part_00